MKVELDKTLPEETARVEKKQREHIQLFNKIVALRNNILDGNIQQTKIVSKLTEIINWDVEILLPDDDKKSKDD